MILGSRSPSPGSGVFCPSALLGRKAAIAMKLRLLRGQVAVLWGEETVGQPGFPPRGFIQYLGVQRRCLPSSWYLSSSLKRWGSPHSCDVISRASVGGVMLGSLLQALENAKLDRDRKWKGGGVFLWRYVSYLGCCWLWHFFPRQLIYKHLRGTT